jgi:hypothetical protein
MRNFALICVFAVAAVGGVGHAQENLGRLQVDRFSLRPEMTLRERQDGGFAVARSLLGGRWLLDERVSAAFAVGTLDLRARPYLYRDEVGDSDAATWGWVEAYGTYAWPGVTLSMGLLPSGYGRRGIVRSEHEDLRPALVYRQGLIVERDFGVALGTERQGFFSRLSVHNGEGEVNSDERAWLTGQWGFKGQEFRAMVFGQSGSTKPVGTADASLVVAGFDKTVPSRWRMGGVFLQYRAAAWEAMIEIQGGKPLQALLDKPNFNAGHIEVRRSFSDHWGFFGRYDLFDPNDSVAGDALAEGTLAFYLRNATNTSSLSVQLVRVDEEGAEIMNDEIRLAWRFSPLLRQASDW